MALWCSVYHCNADSAPMARHATRMACIHHRLPFWQVATLSLGTFAVLMVVMSYTAPFHVHKHSTSTSTTGAAGPKCYPLSDTERVKLLGSQNKAVRRRIVTESKSAQTLFDLGLLHAWGFERSEAIGNFQVGHSWLGWQVY